MIGETGSLANAKHRLHYIKDEAYFVAPNGNPLVPRKPDWDTFLSDELVAKDEPIEQTWDILLSLLFVSHVHSILFITARPERTREMTKNWLLTADCDVRSRLFDEVCNGGYPFALYMRPDGDRRPSHIIKEELLNQARRDGYDPTLVFEDRADDTAMWRRNGLLCCQVAEGNY